MKPELTFEQRIIAAYLHYVQGVPQDVIATAFIVNGGRVNEACLAIKQAAERGRRMPYKFLNDPGPTTQERDEVA